MADNFVANPGSGGDTFAADDIGGVKYPRSKVGFGADGAYSDVDASSPLPIGGTVELGSATLAALEQVTAVGPLTDSQLRAAPVDVLVNQPDLVPFSYSQAGVITVNTVLMNIDCQRYRFLTWQCTSMGTSGIVTPEWSTDNTNWVGVTYANTSGATGTAFSTTGMWQIPVIARYFRMRLSTATTGGTTAIQLLAYSVGAGVMSSQNVQGTVTASLSAGTNLAGDVGLQVRANATGAATPFNYASPATSAGTQVKTSAGRIHSISLTNTSMTTRYVKFFNVSSAPTMGTTSALYEYPLPAGQSINVVVAHGIAHTTGIFIAVTTALGLTNNTSTTVAGDVAGFITFA